MKFPLKLIKSKNFFPLLIVVFFAILAGRSLIFEAGYFNMHDDLQMMRQLQMEKCFQDFQIPCRWVPDMGYGFGFPLFNYYPPLPYLIGQVIRVFGATFVITIKLTFALSFIVSGITMYLLAKDFFGRIGGTLSAVFYIWAPYHAVDVYVRGAMNEAWALAWFPLIFWAGYRLIVCHPGASLRPIGSSGNLRKVLKSSIAKRQAFIQNDNFKWTILLAVSWFALLTSHNLMVLMLTPVFGIWLFIHLWQRNAWHKIPQLIISGFWALGLAAFYTFPALLENQLTHINTALEGYFEYFVHFANLNQLFISRFWGYDGSEWGVINDGMSFSVGHLHWILSILIGAGMVATLVIKKSLKKNPILLSTLFMLIVGWISLFLVHSRSTFIWKAIPFLKLIQFPWRFLAISIFAFSFIVGYPVSILRSKRRFFGFVFTSLRMTTASFLIILLVIFNWKYFEPRNGKMGQVTDEEKLSGEAWILQQKAGIMDYLPMTAKKAPTSAQTVLAEVMQGEGTISKDEQGTYWGLFNADVESEEAVIRINIFDFPNWKVSTENVEVQTFIPETEEWGRFYIKLPKGNHQVYTQFFNTPTRTVSNIISLVSWGGLFAYIFWAKSNRSAKI